MPPLGPSFVAGAFAGYGVAIPVGAIAVLIIDTALRRGLGQGLAAGAGAATADGVYALIAALAGAAVAALIEPVAIELRIVSVVVLAVIAIRGFIGIAGQRSSGALAEAAEVPRRSARRTYLTFLGLTIINPMTVIYFTALILGLPALGEGAPEQVVFVLGAFLASLSWQSLLALGGSMFHKRLPARLQVATSLVGNLIVLGFALNIARGVVVG